MKSFQALTQTLTLYPAADICVNRPLNRNAIVRTLANPEALGHDFILLVQAGLLHLQIPPLKPCCSFGFGTVLFLTIFDQVLECQPNLNSI